MPRSLPARALYYLERLRGWVEGISARLVTRWRRSLQLRVVALTLVLTAAVVTIVGYILMTQIRDQLLSAKQAAAIQQVSDGVQYLDRELKISGAGTDDSLSDTVSAAVLTLQQRGSAAGQFYLVAVQRSPEGRVEQSISNDSNLVLSDDLDSLQAKVADGNVAWQYSTMELDGVEQQVLIVASPVPGEWSEYELYYVYPMQNEIEIMSFVQRTVAAAAIAFLVLIPGVGLLVSRLVVLPVRQARQTAQKIADGDLQQRMDVRGEDDLARLGIAFNEMAASLSSQITRLETLSRVQQRFTSDVSHELRTPLTTVRMAAELLYDYREDFPEAAARSAELMHAELDRFEALLKDLLEISRYDAGGLALDALPSDIAALVKDVASAHRALAAEQGCELVVSIAEGVGEVEISPRRIERVLRNLIANALEHGAGAPVEIEVAADDRIVAIGVRDHGVGIDDEAAAHLFDRFWRADPSRVRKLGGTGLGMAISLEDVRLHLGWLHVWGSPARGTYFRVTLPVHAGEPVTHSTLPLLPDGESGGSIGGVPELIAAPAAPDQASSNTGEHEVVDQ